MQNKNWRPANDLTQIQLFIQGLNRIYMREIEKTNNAFNELHSILIIKC
jgi:hypothetical protein